MRLEIVSIIIETVFFFKIVRILTTYKACILTWNIMFEIGF